MFKKYTIFTKKVLRSHKSFGNTEFPKLVDFFVNVFNFTALIKCFPHMYYRKHIYSRRMRYYSSYEEATIVKLWREHLSEITSFRESSQVFGKISIRLQHHHIRLNSKQVRRRISFYRNKYLTECRRLKRDPNFKSTWRLHALVDSLFNSTTTSSTILTESKALEQIEANVRKELPNLHSSNRHDSRLLKFEQDANGCPFFEGTHGPLQIKSEMLLESTDTQLPIAKAEPTAFISAKRSLLMPANQLLEDKAYPDDSTSPGAMRRSRCQNIMPRTGQITLAEIELLRQENNLLARQLDDNLAALEASEQLYKKMEQTFDNLLYKQQIWMALLAERGIHQPEHGRHS